MSTTPRSTASQSGEKQHLPGHVIDYILRDKNTIATQDQLTARRRKPLDAIIDPHSLGIATAPLVNNDDDNLISFDYNGSQWKLSFKFGVFPKVYILKGRYNRHAIQYDTEHRSVITVNETEFTNVTEKLVMMDTMIATVRRGQPTLSNFRNTTVKYINTLSFHAYMSDIHRNISKGAKMTLKEKRQKINSIIPPIIERKVINLSTDPEWKLIITRGVMQMIRDRCVIKMVVKNGGENQPYIIEIDETDDEEMRDVMVQTFISAKEHFFPPADDEPEPVVKFTRSMPLHEYMKELNLQQGGGRGTRGRIKKATPKPKAPIKKPA